MQGDGDHPSPGSSRMRMPGRAPPGPAHRLHHYVDCGCCEQWAVVVTTLRHGHTDAEIAVAVRRAGQRRQRGGAAVAAAAAVVVGAGGCWVRPSQMEIRLGADGRDLPTAGEIQSAAPPRPPFAVAHPSRECRTRPYSR